MNDITQARITLSRLKEEITEKASELQSVVSNVDRIKAQIGSETQRLSDTRAVIEQEERIKLALSTENKGLEEEYHGLRNKIDDMNSLLEGSKAMLDLNRRLLAQLYADIQIGLQSLSSLESEIKEKKEQFVQEQEQIKSLEDKERAFADSISKHKKVLESVLQDRAKVESSIDKAIEKFRVFEGRIQALSQETGYVLSYPKPYDK